MVSVRSKSMRDAPIRDTSMRDTPMRDTSIGCIPCKMHAYEMAPVRDTSMRWPMGDARL
jgi:hypothetical protein